MLELGSTLPHKMENASEHFIAFISRIRVLYEMTHLPYSSSSPYMGDASASIPAISFSDACPRGSRSTPRSSITVSSLMSRDPSP
mmetsp:Transcript_28561/g.60894  ORF Transcript_28561/g.60894 Transcript_28561/m.60894 type:complete len:85 (-) Transcript_28561:1613-1867(-)